MHNKPLRRRHRSRGQIIAVTGMILPVLLAFAALALDGGVIYHAKRHMQAAADAGALGGAKEIWRQNIGQVTSGAKNDVALNGFTDANATITVNNPPSSGPRTGDTNFVEVIISQQVPTFLMRILGPQQSLVRARAVAGIWKAPSNCVAVLDPTQRGALTVQGGATLTATCPVTVNSSDSQGVSLNGGGCVNAEQFGVSGGSSAGCANPQPTTGIPPTLDPLAYMGAPTIPPLLPLRGTNLKINTLIPPLLPGQYNAGISVSGGSVTFTAGTYVINGGINISGGVVSFGPGLYILNGGGLSISGNAIVSGNGVTFYNTWSGGGSGGWGDINIAGTTTVNLKAPSSGDYEGMLLWTDRNAPYKNNGSTISGGVNSSFEGVLYFPSTDLTFSGTSTGTAWTMLIADTLKVAGNTIVQSDYSASDITPPTRVASVVE